MKLSSNTIQDSLAQTLARFGDRSAVKTADGEFTWREIGILSDALADQLAQRGIGRGEHVGLWGENSLNWILTFLAVIKLGAVAVLINNNYTERELRDVLQISDTKWLCFGGCPELERRPELPTLVMSACGIDRDRAFRMENAPEVLRQWLSEPRGEERKESSDCREVCCLLFTSGSTERPKCVMMNHYSLINNAVSMAEKLKICPSDNICLSTPLFHIFCLCGSFLASCSNVYSGTNAAF